MAEIPWDIGKDVAKGTYGLIKSKKEKEEKKKKYSKEYLKHTVYTLWPKTLNPKGIDNLVDIYGMISHACKNRPIKKITKVISKKYRKKIEHSELDIPEKIPKKRRKQIDENHEKRVTPIWNKSGAQFDDLKYKFQEAFFLLNDLKELKKFDKIRLLELCHELL